MSFSEDAITNLNLVSIADTNYMVGFPIQQNGLFLKRVINAPTGLSAADVEINYRLGTQWYYTDEMGDVFDAGIWEKTDIGDGTLDYHKLTTLGLVHRDIVGPPTEPPTRPGQGAVDDLGRLWLAAGEWIYNHLSATGTASPFTNAQYVAHPATRPDILADGGDGGFTWLRNGGQTGFAQYQGTSGGDYTENLLWNGVGGIWSYIAEHVHTAGAAHDLAVHYRDNSVFLGGFSSRAAAVSELALRITDAEFVANTYIYGDNRSNVGGLHVINSFTGGSTVRSDNFTWNGPHATTHNVAQYFEQHSYLFTKDELVAGAGISITADDSDQTLTIAATGTPTPGTSDGVVESGAFDLTGQDLGLTLVRSVGADVVIPAVTLPAGGGGGGGSFTSDLILDGGAISDSAVTLLTLTEDIEVGHLIEFTVNTAGAEGVLAVSGDEWLIMAAQAATPTTVVGAKGFRLNSNATALTNRVGRSAYVWRSANANEVYAKGVSIGGTITMSVRKSSLGGSTGPEGPPGASAFSDLTGTIEDAQIPDDRIIRRMIDDAAVDGDKIADNSIGASHIIAGGVGSSEIATDAVKTPEIQDGAVTEAKLAQAVIDQLGGGVRWSVRLQ